MIRLKSKLQRVGAALCVLASWLALHSQTASAQTTLSVTPTSTASGSTVTATWSGIASPTGTDWIGLHRPGTPSQSFIDWVYVSCSKSTGAARPSGSCSFPIAATLASGTYELRLHRANGYTVIATSGALTVTSNAGGSTTLSINPTSVASGASVTATWSGIASPVATNWIGLHLPGTAPQQYIDWMYVSCSKVASAARAAGSCAFPIPAGLTSGSYELRLYGNGTFNVIATSGALTVSSGGTTGGGTATNVVQFLTHDNFSGPSNFAWNHILAFPWKRGVWGDWLDAQQKPFGTSSAGAVPYGSVAIPQPGRYSVAVTPLVQRWMANTENRGFYLRMRGNDFSVQFAGRAAADTTTRPKLSVTTTTGTYILDARCSAGWSTTSSYPINRADLWTLAGLAPAILQFDLGAVKGSVTQATLSFSDLSHAIGSTSSKGIIDVFEADPPRFVVPDDVASPVLGIAANYTSFQSLASDPGVFFSDDFASPGWSDKGFVHPVERILNPQTGTTYARGQYVAGSNSSASIYKDVVLGTGPNGSPDKVVPELFGQYHLYLEKDFGSTIDGTKIPGMSVQYGYWTQTGYWAPITGNGGSRGTGLKVWNAAQNRWEYQGHSVRSLLSKSPADQSAYGNLFALALYPYNLDQTGPYPDSESYPYIALQRERWYTIDLQLKQNSIVGPYDAVGNGTAVADGVVRIWINGLPVYQKSSFRWRRHPEFGVQGIWIDFYHGGTPPAPYTMHYRVDRVSLARSYIGPLRR